MASSCDGIKAMKAVDSVPGSSSSPQLTRKALDSIEETESSGVPLNTPWTFWLDKTTRGTSAAEYEASLRKLYTVQTVQGFWRVYNNLPKASQLNPRYSYHLMRNTSRPVWEDECNCRGGNWRMKCGKMDSNNVWQELLLAAIGEQFMNCMATGDDIVGLSVSVRERDDIIQIWNRDSRLSENSTILEKVKQLLPDVQFFTVFYKAFDTHEAFEGAKG
jgi:hypothetical protein